MDFSELLDTLEDDEEILIRKGGESSINIFAYKYGRSNNYGGFCALRKKRAAYSNEPDNLKDAIKAALQAARKEYKSHEGPKIVRCIDEGYNNMHYPVIIHGDTYEVVDEDHDTYMVKTDDYGNLHLPKYLFKPLNFEQKEG